MSTKTDIIKFIKSKSIEFARAVGDSLCVGDLSGIEFKSSVPDDIFDDTPLLRGISYDITGNATVYKHRGSLSVDPPILFQSKSDPNDNYGCNINDESDIANDLVSFNFTKLQLKRFNKVINGKFGVHRLWETLTDDVVSIMFQFLNKNEIGMFKCVSKDTKFITNQYCLRYCKWMVNKRNTGDYVLKYIKNFDDMKKINIDTLTWSNKYNGNENWDTIHNIINTNNDDSKNDVNDITSDDIWYLLNEYWFGNKNFGWGTFERSKSRRKQNGEWRILNNSDIYDRQFYLNVNELNGILAMLKHPLLITDFVNKNTDDCKSKIGSENKDECNDCLRQPISIMFDKRNNLKSRIGSDNKLFDSNGIDVVKRNLHCYMITYWNGAVGFKATGIKISGYTTYKSKREKDNPWVKKEILYCNFLTNIYYGNKLNWEWYNNDTCEYIQYSMDNKGLINQLECNYQSNNLNVFTRQDRSIINITLLSELKKCLKATKKSSAAKNEFERTKYFKFRCFHSNSGQLNIGQIAMTKVTKYIWNDYDRQIKRTLPHK